MGGKRRLDPFEPGIELEERQDRMRGYVLKLKRKHNRQEWEEILTVTALRTFDETSGILSLFALTGKNHKRLDPYRECGQARTIHINEIVKVKYRKQEGPAITTATKAKKTPKTKAAPKTKDVTKKAKPTLLPKGNRHEKREKALALRKQGKTYKEIQIAVGFANAGAACNAVKRAQAAEEAK